MNERLDKKGAMQLFCICWLIYFCSYLGRLNYSSVMNELIGTVMTKAQAGWVNTAFLVAYAAGQLINGMLAEKVSPRWFAAAGAIGGGVLNIAFSFARSFGAMFALRLATGFCMSMLWPSLLFAMVKWMQHEDKISGTVNIASSMAAGTLLSYAMSALLIKYVNWGAAFWVPGVALCASGALWLLAYPGITRRATVVVEANESAAKPQQNAMPLKQLIAVPVLLVAVIPVVLHGVIKDGVTAWVPTYISERFAKSTSFSSLVSVLLPLFNLTGAYLAQFAYKKAKENTLAGAAVFFAVAAAMLALMLTAGAESLIVTVLSFAVITSMMMAVNILLINLLPLQFEKAGRSATVSGALNAIAYAGSALASGLIGVLSSAYGWNVTVISWFAMMLVAGAVCVLCRKAPGAGEIKEEAERA